MIIRKNKCAKLPMMVLCLIFMLMSGLFFAGAEANEDKMTVAVVEFQVKGDIGIKDAGAIIAEWMISALIETGKFSLNERVLLAKVLEEQTFSESGLVDEKTIAKAGQLFGVQGIVTGSVLQWGETTSVTARLIDTASGEIIKAADVKVGNVDRIPDEIKRLANIIAGSEVIAEVSPVIYETVGHFDIVGTWKRSVAWSNSVAGFRDDGTCMMKHVFKNKVKNNRSGRYRASAVRQEVDESDTSTKRSKIFEGTWTNQGSEVVVRWDDGFIDTMTISGDGKRMDGLNNWGFGVTCTKIADETDLVENE